MSRSTLALSLPIIGLMVFGGCVADTGDAEIFAAAEELRIDADCLDVRLRASRADDAERIRLLEARPECFGIVREPDGRERDRLAHCEDIRRLAERVEFDRHLYARVVNAYPECFRSRDGDPTRPDCSTVLCASGTMCHDTDRGPTCVPDECRVTRDERGNVIIRCPEPPFACPRIFAPVCGRDGVTYSSGCEARLAGATPYTEGECRPEPPTCPPDRAPVCGADGITYPNACEARLAGATPIVEGECRREPDGSESCPRIWAPVCGADGVTYANSCLARFAGATPVVDGECREPDPVCPRIIAPVCGSDGVTYENECLARLAGATPVTDGACATTRR